MQAELDNDTYRRSIRSGTSGIFSCIENEDKTQGSKFSGRM